MTNPAATVRISDIHNHVDETVTIKGWVYSRRGSGKVQFLHIRDGSGFIQSVVAKAENEAAFEKVKALRQECAITVTGTVSKEERAPYCGFEMHLTDVVCISESENYPITKKAHGDAFLMDNRHLWLRSRKQFVILRVRATIERAIRDYLDDKGFLLVDSPIFTPNACEGTSTLFETDWFDGRKAYLSQSGQLYQEATAMAFGKTYCFGPTFRAEKSKTRRHLNEFWMVEPEVAYLELDGLLDLCEDFLATVVKAAVDKHGEELQDVLGRDITLLENIQKPFPRLTYDECIEKIKEIQANTEDPELKTQLDIEWGMDFGSPHETELTKLYDRPIMVTHYPAQVKAFYMKKDPSNQKLAKCVDVLAPEGYGEIIGGAQREDDLNALEQEIKNHGLKKKDFAWFLDLRKYGTVPHAGFGMGLERAVAWVCGLNHLRETIPFARTLDRLYP